MSERVVDRIIKAILRALEEPVMFEDFSLLVRSGDYLIPKSDFQFLSDLLKQLGFAEKENKLLGSKKFSNQLVVVALEKIKEDDNFVLVQLRITNAKL